MPCIMAPDIQYVMDSSFELLEQTPDVYLAASYSNMNLNNYFDMYDAHYSSEGACSSIVNLNAMMHEWIDKQDDLTRGLILSSNIYGVKLQLNELITGVSNILVKNYLNNNNIRENNVVDDRISYIHDALMVESNIVNVTNKEDILFPANIATAIMQDKRMFEYLMMLKNQLKKSFSIDASFKDLHKNYLKIVKGQIDYENFTLDENNLVVPRELVSKQYQFEIQNNAKKALKKGIKKFSNLFGKENINSFINGDGFIVEGKLYNWQFRQKNDVSLIKMTHQPLRGHIPYSLKLLTKDNVVIADCCVYVSENTPIIDQLITIVLYIQHDEAELFKNCNLFNVKEVNKIDSQFNNYESIVCSKHKKNDGSFGLISEYSNAFNELNRIYRPQIKDVISQVIGIDDRFFNFMLKGYDNPIITGRQENFYLDDFSDIKLLT